jgi:hypothetical protein
MIACWRWFFMFRQFINTRVRLQLGNTSATSIRINRLRQGHMDLEKWSINVISSPLGILWCFVHVSQFAVVHYCKPSHRQQSDQVAAGNRCVTEFLSFITSNHLQQSDQVAASNRCVTEFRRLLYEPNSLHNRPKCYSMYILNYAHSLAQQVDNAKAY